MNIEQFNRAREIASLITQLSDAKTRLNKIIERGIKDIVIESKNPDRTGITTFAVGPGANLGGLDAQPELAQLLSQAFVITLSAAYDKEIQKLESEFNSL